MKATEMKQLSQDSVRDEINTLIEILKRRAIGGFTSIGVVPELSEAARSWLIDNEYKYETIEVANQRIVITDIKWD